MMLYAFLVGRREAQEEHSTIQQMPQLNQEPGAETLQAEQVDLLTKVYLHTPIL